PVDIEFSATTIFVDGKICGNCTGVNKALSFAAAINSHPSVDLQGLTVTTSGANAVFQGALGVYYDFAYTDPIAQPNSDIGKIVYNSNTNDWYLPVVGT